MSSNSNYLLTNEDNLATNKKIIAKRYRIEKKLGSGNYGTAFLVNDLKNDELKVLKEVSIGEMDPDESIESVQEANLLSKLDNPYILKYHDSFLDGEYFCIVTEYCEGGDLDVRFKQLKKQNKRLSEKQVLDWTVQLLSAVNFLHSRRVLHRDLKARNVFLKNETIKIGDFGISKILNGTMDMAQTFTGTPYYMSPEVLKHEGYNSKSDIWSIGCLLYEMCTYKHAFEGQGLMGVMYKIIECDVPQLPGIYSKELNNILKKIFQKDPALRPSSSELLREPLISNHIKEMISKLELNTNESLDSTIIQKMDRTEIAKSLSRKVTLQDLKAQQAQKNNEDFTIKQTKCSNSTIQDQEKLTPKEKLLQKKLQKADEEAVKISQMAKENLQERILRDTFRRESTLLNSSISNLIPNLDAYRGYQETIKNLKSNLSAYSEEKDNNYTRKTDYNSTTLRNHVRSNYDDDYDDDCDVFDGNHTKPKNDYQRSGFYDINEEDDGTLLKTVQYQQATNKQNSTYYETDRPIAPLRKQIEKAFDEDGIPVDPELTNNYYENFDFEVDDASPERSPKSIIKTGFRERSLLSKTIGVRGVNSSRKNKYDENSASKTLQNKNKKSNAEYEHLVNIKNSLLENPKLSTEKTFGDGLSGAFGANTRTIKIQNLRKQAIQGLGEDVFKKCYSFLKESRRGIQSDESKIFEGLRTITQNTKACFLVDQLIFLEESS